MNFREFISGYIKIVSKFILGLFAVAIILAPIVLGICLATFTYSELIWLVLLVIVTLPIGLWIIIKIFTEGENK